MVPALVEKGVSAEPGERYSVGEVARMVGISASTLRAWERYGLLRSSRTPAGWRRYDTGEVTRAREVHRLREVEGLAVHAIRRRLRDAPPRERSRPRPAVVRPASPTINIAAPLREKRQELHLSLRALAVSAGVSASLVSGVERGVVHPSVASLQKLSAALGTTVGALLGTTTPACRPIGGEVAPLHLPIPGVRIEDLSGTAQLLEPQRFVIEPGFGSGGEYTHEGEEFLFVIDGTLSITIDGRDHFDVTAGSSLCFESTRRHRWWNAGPSVTRVLWINTPRTF